MISRPLLRRGWSRALVLAAVLVAFLVPALLGQAATLCFCADGENLVSVGCCCPHETPAPNDGDKQCGHDADPGCDECGCVDVHGSDAPAIPDRAPEPLPGPAFAFTLPATSLASVAVVRSAPASLVRPPPCARGPAELPRVLRC